MSPRAMRKFRKSGSVGSSLGTMMDASADYKAAKASRFKRRRNLVGGAGDAHYVNETDFFRIIDEVRDMERNEWVVGRLLDLSRDYEIRGGPSLDPNTGDTGLDRELADRFEDWSTHPALCDIQGERNFVRLLETVNRSYKRDGDVFAHLTDTGAIEVLEADRCRTPKDKAKKTQMVHGVEMDAQRRKVRFWFANESWSKREIQRKDMTPVDAMEGDVRVLLHVTDPDRVTQARGVTPFARIFDRVGMEEDLEFANLVKHQAVSAFAVAITRMGDELGGTSDVQLGNRETETRADGSTETIEGISVGTLLRLGPGEQMTGFSPNIPSDNFFQHVRMVLQQIGVTLGLPLVLILMDAKETNFSGYRGAMEQARERCRRNRTMVSEPQFLRPVYEFLVARWAAKDPAMAALTQRPRKKVRLDRHSWKWPGWSYIQPEVDAKADKGRKDNLLASPRQIYADLGHDIEDIRREIVEDNAATIEAAAKEAAQLIKAYPDIDVCWRDLLFLLPETPRVNPAAKPPAQPPAEPMEPRPKQEPASA